MPINAALRTLLTNELLENHPDQEKVLAALNSLLAAGSAVADSENFKKAIHEHRDFWNSLLPPNSQIAADLTTANNNNFLVQGGTNPFTPDNFEALTKLAAAKMAMLSLKEANEAQLSDIITAPIQGDANILKAFRQKFFNQQGTSVFKPAVKIKSWDENTSLDQTQFAALQTEAKRQLLIKKINECTDSTKLHNLLTNFDATTVGNLLPGVAPNVVGSMLNLRNDPAVRRAIAKKGLLLEIAGKTPAELLELGPRCLDEADDGRFKNAYGASNFVAALDDRDIKLIKADLGSRFLRVYVTTLPDRPKLLEDIAKSANARALKVTLKGAWGPAGTYLDLAIKDDDSIADLRELAARNALKQKIAKCDDPAALDALINAKNNNDIKAILKTHASLGYKDEPEFQTAFNKPDVKDLVALAHVRKNLNTIPQNDEDPAQNAALLSSHCEKLKAVFLSENLPYDYPQKFLPADVVAANPQLQSELITYFTDPANVTKGHKEALLTYVKAKLSDASLLNDTDLRNMLGTVEQLRAGVNRLLGTNPGNSTTLALIPNRDAVIGLEIRRSAAAEDMIRHYKGSPINHTDTLTIINGLDTYPNEITRLVADAPKKEKHRVLAQMAESLVRDSLAVDRLAELAKETKLEEFKNKLTTHFGINNRDWVDEKTMEQVQKAALLNLNQRKATELLKFGRDTHPKLMELIAKLSFEKQKVLLDKPQAINALAGARDKDELTKIINDRTLVRDLDALITDVVKENEKGNLFAQIANSEVARILMAVRPPVVLTPELVGEINDALLNNTYRSGDAIRSLARGRVDFDWTGRVNEILEIGRIIYPGASGIASRGPMYQAFGLDANGNQNAGSRAIMNAIQTQHDHNKILIKTYNQQAPIHKPFCLGLLSLNSNSPLTADMINALREDFVNTKTYSEFIDAAKKRQTNPYLNSYTPPLDQQLTPQMYKQIEIQESKLVFLGTGYQNALIEQGTELKNLREKLNEVQADYSEEGSLARLSEMSKESVASWFDPAFQTTSKKNAAKMEKDFTEFSKQCDSHVTYLSNQLDAVQLLIDSLPEESKINDASQNRAIAKRRAEIMLLKGEVEKELSPYKALQMIFKGDPEAEPGDHPVMEHGMLKMMANAKVGKRDLELTAIEVETTDYPLSEKENHLKKNYALAAGQYPSNSTVEADVKEKGYKEVNAIPAGHFREKVITCPGGRKLSYIEEQFSNAPGVDAKGKVQYSASIKLTANKVAEKNSPQDMVTQASLMAFDMVAKLAGPPTAKNQIVIKPKGTPEFAEYLTIAIHLALEASYPGMKFGDDAVDAPYDIKSERGYVYGWAKDSKVTTEFEKSPEYKALVRGIKKINEVKSGGVNVERKDAVVDVKNISTSQSYRDKVAKMNLENKKQESDDNPTLSSGPKP